MKPGLLIAQLALLVLAVVMACVFPGAPAALTVSGLALTWAVTAVVYSRCSWRTTAGWIILLIVMALMIVGVTLNVWYFTTYSGGTLTAPVLTNDDALRVWYDALDMTGRPGGYQAPRAQHGYTFVLLLVSGIFWPNILTPLVFNALCVLLTVIATGALSRTVAPDNVRRDSFATLCMGLMASVCYFTASGAILLKDALMCLASALMLLGALRIGRSARWMWLVIGIFIIQAVVRPGTLLPSAILMALLVFAPDLKASRGKFIGLAILAAGIWCFEHWVIRTTPFLPGLLAHAPGSEIINHEIASHQAWYSIIGDYTTMVWWQKLLWLPVSFVVECITPFPWNFMRDTVWGPSQAWAHVTYPWYLILGVLIYFAFTSLRKAPRSIALIFAWAVIVALSLAYMNGGNIARHSLPLLPAVMPAAAYTIMACGRKRSFAVWMTIYCIMVAGGLVLCHHLQMAGM